MQFIITASGFSYQAGVKTRWSVPLNFLSSAAMVRHGSRDWRFLAFNFSPLTQQDGLKASSNCCSISSHWLRKRKLPASRSAAPARAGFALKNLFNLGVKGSAAFPNRVRDAQVTKRHYPTKANDGLELSDARGQPFASQPACLQEPVSVLVPATTGAAVLAWACAQVRAAGKALEFSQVFPRRRPAVR